MEECIESSGHTCDMIMEEDCKYLGENVYESPSGSVKSKDNCQDLCIQFEFSGCNYWNYVGKTSTCYLYGSKERACQAVGGPQHPNISECMSKD